MNTTFNFNRIGLLIKRFFMENKQKEITFWGITTVIFMIMREPTSVEMFLYISGFIFAARMFKEFGYTPGGMHYLLIPTTQLEKLISNILLSIVYYFIMFLITYTIGTIFGTLIGNLILSTQQPVGLDFFQISSISTVWENNIVHHNGFWNIFLTFAQIQSIFMLGSLYFKRNALSRTFLSLIIIMVVLVLIEVFLLRITFGTYQVSGQSLKFTFGSGENLFSGFEIAAQILQYLFIPFLWVVSYFRLTEKQV